MAIGVAIRVAITRLLRGSTCSACAAVLMICACEASSDSFVMSGDEWRPRLAPASKVCAGRRGSGQPLKEGREGQSHANQEAITRQSGAQRGPRGAITCQSGGNHMAIRRSKRAERGNRMTIRRQSHDNQALKKGREGQSHDNQEAITWQSGAQKGPRGAIA
jgi:hypothetical protein